MAGDAGESLLRDEANVRVNCLVPSWIASPAPRAYWETLTPEQRRERGVPSTLISLEEDAGAIFRLATDESLRPHYGVVERRASAAHPRRGSRISSAGSGR